MGLNLFRVGPQGLDLLGPNPLGIKGPRGMDLASGPF